MNIPNWGGWLIPSLLAILCWGIWGFTAKIGSEKVSWQVMMVYLGVATLLVAIIGRPTLSLKELNIHHLAGVVSAISCSLGYLFFYIAIKKGEASVVTPLTALYVAVAAILAFIFLSEPITFKKALGILSAIIAMILLA